MRIIKIRVRTRTVAGVLLAVTLTGCASLPSRHSFGVRPDDPVGVPSETVQSGCEKKHPKAPDAYTACLAFDAVTEWSVNLEEAYRSRASQNRWWIYVGGTLGLATVAATGGLAAAAATSFGTLSLLSISGGFATGFFAFLDNSALAQAYTTAAEEVSTARAAAIQRVDDVMARTPNLVGAAYYEEAGKLRVTVIAVRNELEAFRSNAAAAALQRAQRENEQLKKRINDMESSPAVQVVRKGRITAMDPQTITTGAPKPVMLTVSNVNLVVVPQQDIKVSIGTARVAVKSVGRAEDEATFFVTFVPPADPPDAKGAEGYVISLLVKDKTVESDPTLRLRYEPEP